MMRFSSHSLEANLIKLFVVPIITVAIMVIGVSLYFTLDWLELLTLVMVILLPSVIALYKAYQSVFNTIARIAVQLDSIANEEFTVWQLAQYRQGSIANLKSDLKTIAQRIQNKRYEYAQNEAFVFDFINELELPILVLDHHYQVYHFNGAANEFYEGFEIAGRDIHALKLERNNGKWQVNHKNQRFKVVEHELYRGGRKYHLMVYVSIELSLRRNEQEAWQKLVRVLNHEVRNSLTPIYSMAQSLKALPVQGEIELRDTMLDVIEKRSEHLLGFVASYSQLSQLPKPHKVSTCVAGLSDRLQALFPKVNVQRLFEGTPSIYCDVEQLEQALLNLVKNAEQANALAGESDITLAIGRSDTYWCLDVIDNGNGVSQSDNLFVPFYSTKEQGNGIGLVLSREIVRGQAGELTLENRQDKQGAVARICLPI
ncbi:ATP-binding protein [Pseudoalteromonas sp. SMS1]|uniref:sensor histidine kinase n=1 Tax=Pseudoalteromonas sp. SMS1 TaxID=2908894 RepID=UPI001F1D9F7C|nr:ATP-binding protein [Pseudoalteromonas sp. SMS1]MCF2858330.1 ATP-binding protein [Pseudoalteromonas sp. SMS1]